VEWFSTYPTLIHAMMELAGRPEAGSEPAVSGTAEGPIGREAVPRGQLASSFRALLALSVVMTSSRDETKILRLAATAVPSLGNCRTEAIFINGEWHVAGPIGHPANAESLDVQPTALDRCGGPLNVEGAGWACAYPLVMNDVTGYLVVSCDTEPDAHDQFLLTVLALQTGVALVNARLHARQRVSTARERESAAQEWDTAARERAIADELRAANLALEQAMAELAGMSATAQRSLDIHHRFTAVASAGGGPQGIARALHELTRLPVAIEDRHGNLTTWAGPGRPDPYPKPTPARRQQTLRRAWHARGPVRDKDRLIALAQPGNEVLGVIALIDPYHTAGDSEKLALEHANTALTLELAHRRTLAEAELRLRRDLVEELLAGTDAQSAEDRARALGYDLARPHRVVLATNGSQRINHKDFYHAVRRAVRATGVGSLLAARPGGVAVLCDTDYDWEQFRVAITAQMRSPGSCRVGVGAPCTQPCEFPRSHEQAQLALKIQVTTRCPEQATVFDDLGITNCSPKSPTSPRSKPSSTAGWAPSLTTTPPKMSS
jgi:GGDEF-like domain